MKQRKLPIVEVTSVDIIPIFLRKKVNELLILVGVIIVVVLLPSFGQLTSWVFGGSQDCSSYVHLETFNAFCSSVDAGIIGLLSVIALFLVVGGVVSFVVWNWHSSIVEAYNVKNPKRTVDDYIEYGWRHD